MLTNPRSLVAEVTIGLGIGVFSGLFGVGGGIILVPVLVLFLHVAQKNAQATSLVVVPMAASLGALTYALADQVAWGAVLPLIGGGVMGTLLGSALVRRTPDRWLTFFFALLILVAAGRLIWQSVIPHSVDMVALTGWVVLGLMGSGFAMGLLSSFMGVGGGIIVIPLLVAFFGFPQQLAAGTSLVVMIPLALLGAWRLTRGGFTHWGQGLRIGSGAAGGAILGANLALIAAENTLQIAFAVFLVAAAAQMAWKALRSSSR